MSAERSIVADLPEVSVWTDGSCDNMSYVGGYAAVLRFGAHEKSIGGPLENTTSQRCEMTAAIEALKTLKRRSSVTIHTDSRYLMDGATKWAPSWLAKGKLHIKANCDLWSELLCLMAEHEVQFCKVKAHSGVDLNEVVDRMANQARLQRDEDGPEVKGVVHSLDETHEARRRPPRVSDSICWPVESTDNYLRFGREVTRLYPYVQHDKEEVPKVMTPLGVGTIKQAFSDGVKVALDKPVHWLYSKSGKPSPAMEEFQIGEIWPCDEDAEREIGDESSHGRAVPGVCGDRENTQAPGGPGHRDKESRVSGGYREKARTGDEAGEARAEREAAEGNAELSLFQ